MEVVLLGGLDGGAGVAAGDLVQLPGGQLFEPGGILRGRGLHSIGHGALLYGDGWRVIDSTPAFNRQALARVSRVTRGGAERFGGNDVQPF